MIFSTRQALLLVAAAQLSSISAFAPNQHAQVFSFNVASPTALRMSAVAPDQKPEDYGEAGRKLRRTVYTHDDWVKHRSPTRFRKNLSTFTRSAIYRNLSGEVLATTSVATLVVLWNCLVGDYQDFNGVVHAGPMKDSFLPILALPLTPFTLSSPSLGLLLAFRTNQAYTRWDEARKNWGMNINHTRDLVRLGNAYYDRSAVSPERAEEDLKTLALCTWAFVRAMKRHLSPPWEDEEDFKAEIIEKLPQGQATKLIEATHRPNRALQDLSVAIENMPMPFLRKNEIHRAVTIFEDNLGSSERLLSSPVPLFYSRHTARFLSFWLLLLPLALFEPLGNSWNHADMIPVTAILSIFLFGIEELATQLEEPFTILPMQGFCDKIYNWINEITSFSPGDNGMPVYSHSKYPSTVASQRGIPPRSSAQQTPPTYGYSVGSTNGSTYGTNGSTNGSTYGTNGSTSSAQQTPPTYGYSVASTDGSINTTNGSTSSTTSSTTTSSTSSTMEKIKSIWKS